MPDDSKGKRPRRTHVRVSVAIDGCSGKESFSQVRVAHIESNL